MQKKNVPSRLEKNNARNYCSGTMEEDCYLVALMHCKKSTGNNVDLYTQRVTIVQKSENIKMNARAGLLDCKDIPLR